MFRTFIMRMNEMKEKKNSVTRNYWKLFSLLVLFFCKAFMQFWKGKGMSMYFLLTFEPLHHLHLGISKLVAACSQSYLSSGTITICGAQKERKWLEIIRLQVFWGRNVLLNAFKSHAGLLEIRIALSGRGALNGWNGIFQSTGLRRMLE